MFGIINKLFRAKHDTTIGRTAKHSPSNARARLGLEGLERRDMPSSAPVSINTLAYTFDIATHEDAVTLAQAVAYIETNRPTLEAKALYQDAVALYDQGAYGSVMGIFSADVKLIKDAATEAELTSAYHIAITPLWDYSLFQSDAGKLIHDGQEIVALLNYIVQHENSSTISTPLQVGATPSFASPATLNQQYQTLDAEAGMDAADAESDSAVSDAMNDINDPSSY
jgi:hypothetical protein